ncbi:hypothetical protein AGMMS49936_08720 [Endomicrobiia bacterium]|nr:hypothetical protein AGMMS49936_08720 [Endomicrobiia bacterium]
MQEQSIIEELKYFTAKEAKKAVAEAIKQQQPLIVTSEMDLIKEECEGVKLIIDSLNNYKELKAEIEEQNIEKLNYLKLCLVLNNSKKCQELRLAIKNDSKYPFITVDWETDILKSENSLSALRKAVENASNIIKIKKDIKKTNVGNNFTSILKQMVKTGYTPAIKTGFERLDEALGGGLYDGKLYVIGAISSLGKTSFALNIADNIASTGRDVLVFSLEMGKYELMTKSISRGTFELCLKEGMNINNHQALSALEISDKFSYKKYSKEKKEILQLAIDNYTTTKAEHIYISEGMGDIGVRQLRETIDNFKQLGHSAPVVMVDYMQILAPYNQSLNDKQNVDKNATELKRISRDYNIPVILISSFNRTNYLNEVSFESFKESGSIEYAADVVIGLQLKIAGRQNWTESKPTLNEKREIVNEAKVKNPREIELVILKNRMYKAWNKIIFNYYPQFDYFEEIEKGFLL